MIDWKRQNRYDLCLHTDCYATAKNLNADQEINTKSLFEKYGKQFCTQTNYGTKFASNENFL